MYQKTSLYSSFKGRYLVQRPHFPGCSSKLKFQGDFKGNKNLITDPHNQRQTQVRK